MAELPMIEILPRLPLKDLARFKCVSKSWYALISYLHTVLVKREFENKETGEFESCIFSFLKYPFTADDESCIEHLDYPRFGHKFSGSFIKGHSHGILCLSHGYYDLFLYNPTTGELRELPPSILTCPKGFDSHLSGVGMGYDHISRDIKVVRILGFYIEPHFNNCYFRTEVYDLGKDRWREIKTPLPAEVCDNGFFDLYYNGLYYWCAYHNDHSSELLVWFDMTKEVFGLISMPPAAGFHFGDKNFRSLRVLNGSIVLLNFPDSGNVKSFEVWKMFTIGEVVSWTKLFTIGPLFGINYPLTFVSSDQLLMVENDGQLALCNIFNTQDYKRLPIKGDINSIHATVFVKSLLSVKGGDS